MSNKMKKIALLVLMMSLSLPAFAVAPDRRICDCDGDCAAITADGKLMVSSTNEGRRTADTKPCQPDKRLSDNDGDVAAISADGTLQTA